MRYSPVIVAMLLATGLAAPVVPAERPTGIAKDRLARQVPKERAEHAPCKAAEAPRAPSHAGPRHDDRKRSAVARLEKEEDNDDAE